jgi:chlorophyll/bacteriochlorophyll a synthase
MTSNLLRVTGKSSDQSHDISDRNIYLIPSLYHRKLGLNSLPVAFGIDTAKWMTVGTIDLTQLAVAAYLYSIGETTYALALLALIAPQVFFQFKYFIPDPIANDVKYQASAQPFLVFGILDTALAIGHHGPI